MIETEFEMEYKGESFTVLATTNDYCFDSEDHTPNVHSIGDVEIAVFGAQNIVPSIENDFYSEVKRQARIALESEMERIDSGE